MRDPERLRCKAKSKAAQRQCKRPAIEGGAVCYLHGGRASQVRDKAAARLATLAWPAAVKLGKLIDNRNPAIALAAARDVLDRNGFKAIERVQQDGKVLIEIELVDRGARPALEPPHVVDVAPYTNGHVDAGD